MNCIGARVSGGAPATALRLGQRGGASKPAPATKVRPPPSVDTYTSST